MCNWQKWILPGILATAVLTALSMLFHAGSIEKDLSEKAAVTLSEEHGWATVELDGRDLTLTGVAPTEDQQEAAASLTNDIYDVRVVTNNSTLPPIEAPYAFNAAKSGEGITLTGFYPSDDVRAEIVAAAERANPGVAITDNLTIARGAPDAFGELGSFGVSQLGKLADGQVAMSDANYSIDGMASSAEAFEALSAELTGALPAGAALAANEVVPPAVSPFTWSAKKTQPGTLALAGFATSAEQADAIVAAAQETDGSATVESTLQVASGAPEGFDAAATYALSFMPFLVEGDASLVDSALSITGTALDGNAFASVTQLQANAPNGIELTANVEEPAPPAFFLEAVAGDTLVLEGNVPSSDVKDALLAQAQASFVGLNIEDQLSVAEGAPAGFAETASAGLGALSRMPEGRLYIEGNAITIEGGAFGDAARSSILEAVGAGVPQGIETDIDVSLAPGPMEAGGIGALDAAVCQSRLAELLSLGSIRFATGQASIESASFGLLDRLSYTAQACPDTRFEVGGHTDSDGDEASNERLSLQRAEAVVNYLVSSGVETSRLSAIGYGESNPIASNDTDEGKGQNRRIEFNIIQ
ncbi:MAG: OmpA family protein [Pseudomonadota bacterium]